MKRAFIAGVLSAALLAARDYRARVQGSVTDTSQAVGTGARVVLQNDNTGVAAVKASDAAGRYYFDFVEPGTYTLTVELQGFNKFVQQNILVQVRADVTVNAQLQVGAVSETVTVTEAPPALQFTPARWT